MNSTNFQFSLIHQQNFNYSTSRADNLAFQFMQTKNLVNKSDEMLHHRESRASDATKLTHKRLKYFGGFVPSPGGGLESMK